MIIWPREGASQAQRLMPALTRVAAASKVEGLRRRPD